MTVISLHPQPWDYYLAYLASTPRNWLECRLERPEDSPHSPVKVIDPVTPEEVGVARGYPTDGLSVWWTIICLDGAPERLKQATRLADNPYQPYWRALLDIGDPLECRFRTLIDGEMERLSRQPAVLVDVSLQDGIVVGYAARDDARELVFRVAAACAAINLAENLSWTQQFHVRASIGQTARRAFSGLLGLGRDQLYDGERISFAG